MKHLRTYEIFSFWNNKTKKKEISNNKGNILNRYSEEEVLQMFQEFNDDFNLKISIENIDTCHLTTKKSKDPVVWYRNFEDINGETYYINHLNITENLHNCYDIILHELGSNEKKDINKEELLNIMEHKKQIYDFEYIITDKSFERNSQTGILMKGTQWRVFIF